MNQAAVLFGAFMLVGGSLAAQNSPDISSEALNALYRRVENPEQPQKILSPDHRLIAAYRQTHPGVYGRNFGRVTILDQGGRVLASHVLADNGGRLVAVARWSPDSKFCVFTTISAGGHSPWQFEPYVFSTTSRRFRFLGDGSLAAVTDPEFRFTAPATVLFTTPLGVATLQLDAHDKTLQPTRKPRG